MIIRCLSGMRVRRIWPISDELLALTPVVTFLWKPFLVNPLLLLFVVFFGYTIFEIISRFILFRRHAARLKKDTAPWIYQIFAQELSKQKIRFWFKPRLYWIPSRWDRSAQVLGGLRSKILLSGGLVVEAQESPQAAHVVIRHELAHVKAGDTRIYFFLLVFLTYVIWLIDSFDYFWRVRDILAFALSHGETARLIPLIQIPVLLSYFVILLRRREYLADARAINVSDSSDDYVRLLVSGYTEEKQGWFHPNGAERASAILRDSPVLKASPLIIVSALVYIWLWQEPTLVAPGPLYAHPESSQLLFPVLAIAFELLKGWRSKLPLLVYGGTGRSESILSIDTQPRDRGLR